MAKKPKSKKRKAANRQPRPAASRLTRGDVGRILGVSSTQVRRLEHAGELHPKKGSDGIWRCTPEDVAKARKRRLRMGKGADADPMSLARMPRGELEQLCRDLEEDADRNFDRNKILEAQIADARDAARPTMYRDADNQPVAGIVRMLVEELDHQQREAEEMRQILLAKIRAAQKSVGCAAQAKSHSHATPPVVGG
jgi:hypothetical protein